MLKRKLIILPLVVVTLFCIGLPVFLIARQLTVVQDKAPMFKKPSISSPIIKYLEKDSKLNLLAVEDSFYLVSYGGYEGWVVPYSVRDESGGEDVEEKPEAQPAVGESLPSPAEQELAPERYLVVSNAWANVREGPGLSYKIIGKVYKDQRLEKFIKRGRWFRVRLPDSKIGFIREDLVSDSSQEDRTIMDSGSGESSGEAETAGESQTLAERVNRLEREVAELRKALRETQALLLQQQNSGSRVGLPGILPQSSVSRTLEGDVHSQYGKKLIIGNKATKVYHLPDSKFYDKIPEEFRVYFNTEEQAKKAGYTKSLN
jgi:uncharacterized protein YgiM (DUF1202 family)